MAQELKVDIKCSRCRAPLELFEMHLNVNEEGTAMCDTSDIITSSGTCAFINRESGSVHFFSEEIQ